MPKFKQTRQKETPGFSMSNQTESRVIESETKPGGLYVMTEDAPANAQTYDWKTDPLPGDEPGKTPEKDKG